MLVFLNSGNVMEKANQQIKPHTRQIQTLREWSGRHKGKLGRLLSLVLPVDGEAGSVAASENAGLGRASRQWG